VGSSYHQSPEGVLLLLDIIRVVAGLVVLIFAADRLVISAVRIAKVMDISVVIIGAVIVGFGTSIPEFVVSSLAAGEDNLSLGISNVVASNAANLTLVLGSAALLTPIITKHRVIRREGLLMFGSVLLLSMVVVGGEASRLEGAALAMAMVAAVYLLTRWTNEDPDAAESDVGEIDDGGTDEVRVGAEVVFGLIALAATVMAGQQLLLGVEGIGTELGFSVIVMGLITGVGTSLPELSAAIAGARRGHSDLVLGNVLGSNVFNSLGVAGAAMLIGPGVIHGETAILLALMIGSAAVAGLFAFTRQQLSRGEGVILLLLFVVYALASL